MSLFNEPQVDPLPQEIENFTTELVGENKKFKTVEDLAKGKYEADRHITNLEKELQEIRQELQTRIGVKELLEQMKTQQQTPAPSPGYQPDPLDESNETDIESLIEQKLNARDIKRQSERNLKEVQDQLKAAYGNDYLRILKEKTEDLGETPESMDAMARKNPKLLLTILGTSQKKPTQPFFGVPQSSVSSPLRSGETERNWKYYEGIRKSNPSRYFTVDVQKQMHKDAQRLAENFYN